MIFHDANEPNLTTNIDDEDLLRRAVTYARSANGQVNTRETGVKEVFLLGRTFARQLCERFGLNPDEKVRR